MLCGCSRHEGVPVPREYAWPRVAEADTVMRVVEGAPLPFFVSGQARVTAKPGEVYGLDIDYPQYNATIYVTFIPVTEDELPRVMAARLERMRLNLNGAPYDQDKTDTSLVVTARTSAQIPAQLLTRSGRYLVSATATMHSPQQDVPYDSVRPVYEALSRHLSRALH